MKSQDKMLYFEQSEFENRLRKVTESMYRQGMEVLLVTDPADMNYLTGSPASATPTGSTTRPTGESTP